MQKNNLVPKILLLILFLFTSIIAISQIGATEITKTIQKHFPYVPIYEWQEGMSFYLTVNDLNDTKFKLVEGNKLGNVPYWTDYYGEKVIFQGYRTFYGTNLCFVFKINNVNLAYESNFSSLDEIKLRRGFYRIPDLMYIENLSLVKKLFLNIKFQVLKDFEYESAGQTDWSYEYNPNGNAISVKNTVPYPITISNVEYNLSNNNFPIKLMYYWKNKGRSINIRLSGTNSPPYSKCKSNSRNICNLDKHLTTDSDYSIYMSNLRQQSLNRFLEEQRKIKLEEERKKLKQQIILTQQWWDYRNKRCVYRKNLRSDDYSKENTIFSETYNLYEPNYNFGKLNIELIKLKGKNYLRFYSNIFLGIKNSIGNNHGDKVSIALQNGNVINFKAIFPKNADGTHNFIIVSELTNNQILKLKRSPIKSVKLESIYSYILEDIHWKSFFADKLYCIN